MKKIVLMLVCMMSFGAGAMEAPTANAVDAPASPATEAPVATASACINQEFMNMSRQAIAGIFGADVDKQLAATTSAEQHQALSNQLQAFLLGKVTELMAPFTEQTELEDGSVTIEVVDPEIIAVFAPACEVLDGITSSAEAVIDKENPIYKILLDKRNKIEAKIQPQRDEVKAIKDQIAELTQKIADIQSGISAELDQIAEIDNFVEEKLVVPGKPAEEVSAEVMEALQTPEMIDMMTEIVDLLNAKFAEFTGLEVNLVVPGQQPQPQPEPQQPVVEEEEESEPVDEWVPEFKD